MEQLHWNRTSVCRRQQGGVYMRARLVLCEFIWSVAHPVWSICLLTPEFFSSMFMTSWWLLFLWGLKWAASFPPERLCRFMTADCRFISASQEDPPKNSFPYPLLFMSTCTVPKRTEVCPEFAFMALCYRNTALWAVNMFIKCTISNSTPNVYH